MKNSSVLSALVGCFWLSGCGFSGVDGNGHRVEETREAEAFSRVRSDASLDVKITQGDVPAVTVSIDSNLQRLVKTRVADDTLYIDLSDDVGDVVDGPHVLVTAPQLSAAKLAGSGNMTVVFAEPEQPLDLYLSGSGSLRFNGATAAIGAYLSGSGDIRLDGNTGDADLKLSGSGSIRGQQLETSCAAIVLSGSGDIAANVHDSVSVSLSGSGQIDLYGGASIDRYDNHGSGNIVQH
jgi:hypothetical protein